MTSVSTPSRSTCRPTGGVQRDPSAHPVAMRIASPEEAVAGIRSGERVYLQCAAATPSVLLDALVARASDLRDVEVVHLHTEGPGPHLAPEMAGHFRHRALFIGPNARQAVNEGRADYVPMFLSDVPRLFESGALPLDAVFVNATPPDAHGFCSLGTSVEAMHAAIRHAKTVIVQLNPGDAADPRRELHPRDRHRPRHRGRRAALRATRRPDRRGGAADRRVRGGPGPRRCHTPAGHRCDPGGDGVVPAREARPGHPYRDVHRLGHGPRRSRRDHRRPQGAQPRQARRPRS